MSQTILSIDLGLNDKKEVTYENLPDVDRVLFPNLTDQLPYDEMKEIIEGWLDDHPEATTSVEDGSLLPDKLDSSNEAVGGYTLLFNGTKFEWVDLSANFAGEFDASHLGGYSAGEYVMHEGQMYIFTADHAGNWSASDVQAVTVSSIAAGLKNETDKLKQDISYLLNGISDLFTLATPYKGYFSDNGVSSNYSAGLQTNADWGFFVIPVKKGNIITVSGLTTVSGARNVWLNSSNPSDFNSVASKTHETDGTYICKTDYFAITMYNPTAYIANGHVLDNRAKNNLQVFPVLIQADNYTNYLPSINDIATNSVYKLNYAGNDTNLPTGMPFSKTPYGEIFTLITYANLSSGSNIGSLQYLYGKCGEVWRRSKGANWNKWEKCDANGQYITVGASGCDYTAVVPAVMQATRTPNSYVFINDGTYDMIDEIETYVSSTFFTNYTTSQSQGTGINLYNGITIEMTSNAKIVCNYSGSSSMVRSNFSPFVSNYGDFTMINVNIEASNVKYCVHDDNITKNVIPSHHKYVNCSFTLDNTELSGNPDTCAVIGGGLDYSSYVEVIGCYLKSLGSQSRDITQDSTIGCAGYHNTNISNARSHVVIKDTYCENGTLVFGKYGDTTKMTDVEVSNCSMKYQPYTYYEVPAQYEVDNIVLRKWNNEIRT